MLKVGKTRVMGFWKMMIVKANYSYVIKKESITVFRNQNTLNQYISFNCYTLQSRRKFNQFKQVIEKSRPDQYDEINSIYRLARQFEVPASGGRRPTTIVGKIAF